MPRPSALLAAAAAALVASCAGPSHDLEVIEAVFRHQMSANASGQRERAGVFCLKRERYGEDSDPAPELMQRFSRHRVPVRPISQCRVGSGDEGAQVYDRVSGRTGLILSVGKIDCTMFGRCSVEGGYYAANMSSSGNLYRLERKNGRWTVSADRMIWIS